MGGERSVSPADMRFNHSRDHPGVSDSVNTDCELKQCTKEKSFPHGEACREAFSISGLVQNFFLDSFEGLCYHKQCAIVQEYDQGISMPKCACANLAVIEIVI